MPANTPNGSGNPSPPKLTAGRRRMSVGRHAYPPPAYRCGDLRVPEQPSTAEPHTLRRLAIRPYTYDNGPTHALHVSSRYRVGIPGFEPGTPCSQSRCANRTALHPAVCVERGKDNAFSTNSQSDPASKKAFFLPLPFAVAAPSVSPGISGHPPPKHSPAGHPLPDSSATSNAPPNDRSSDTPNRKSCRFQQQEKQNRGCFVKRPRFRK